jgi:hypothetical protein
MNIITNITTSKYKKRNLLEKKEDALLKKLDICKTQKCSSLEKQKNKKSKQFEKEQDKACPKKLSNIKFYDCSQVFYDKSDYKKLFDEYVACTKKKCKKEIQKKKKITKKIIAYDMTKLKNHFSKKNKTKKK